MRDISILLRQKLIAALQNGYVHAETAERLGQLAADRSATENNHVLRLGAQFVEDRFVGEKLDRFNPGNVGNRRARTRGDDKILRAQNLVANLNFVRRQKLGFAAKNIDAERFETFLRIVRRNLGAALAHSLEDFLKGKTRLLSIQSPFFRIADSSDETRGRNQRFTRDAAEVQAIAAHLVALDQGHAAAQPGSARCCDEPSRSRSDHDNVVSPLPFRFGFHSIDANLNCIDPMKNSSLGPVNISIIVPVLNEAAIIRGFLQHLRTTAADAEIIVVDGGSNDGTVELCRGLADHIVESARGRARQMNTGAQVAHGKILWFLHSDSRIATNSLKAIEDVLADSRIVGGCFRLRIVPARWVYRVRDVIGDLCVNLFRIALGDRGLFCRGETFFALGGYPGQPLLEDAEFYCKLCAVGRVRQLPIRIQTSARRYEALGPVRTSLFYLLIMTLYLARTKMSVLEKMVGWFASCRPIHTQRSEIYEPVL